MQIGSHHRGLPAPDLVALEHVSALAPPATTVSTAVVAQRCSVQSALGPSSCPVVGGPYTLGVQCSCQIGPMSPLLSGQVCAGR